MTRASVKELRQTFYVPTPKLRFVRREKKMILQQWFAANVPAYMADPNEGEWRDVELTDET